MSYPHLSNEIVLRLADELEQAGAQMLLPPSEAQRIAEALRGKNSGVIVQLIIPRRITAHLYNSMVDLRFARCARCGSVYNLSSNSKLLLHSKCSCGGVLVPAPVWSITAGDKPSTGRKLKLSSGVKLALSVDDYPYSRPERIVLSLIHI